MMGWGSLQSKGSKGYKGSQGGKGCKGSKGYKGSRGSHGSSQGSSQGSKDGKGHPDGGLSPPEKVRKPHVGGISPLEGAWRLNPLPEDRVLKVLVPFLGNALCSADEKWIALKSKWEKDFNVTIDLRGRKSRGGQSVGSSIARDLAIIGPDYDCVRDAFDFMLDRAVNLQLPDVHEIRPPEMWLQDRKSKKETRSEGDDPDKNMPRPDNDAKLNPDPAEGGAPDWGIDPVPPPKDIFAGRVVKLSMGGWKRFGLAKSFQTEELRRMGKLEEAPKVEQVVSALRESGCRVDYVWDCGLEDSGHHAENMARPAHLGFHAENTTRVFINADEIRQHLAAVRKLFQDTDPESPIHIFFLSRMGMVRSVATAFIVQLAFKDLFWEQQGI